MPGETPPGSIGQGAPSDRSISSRANGGTMSRTSLSLLLAGLVAYVVVSPGHAQNAPAQIAVTLPEDARLLVDGHLTKQTGASRTFASPPLQPGVDYAYDITVEVVRDGKTLTQTK